MKKFVFSLQILGDKEAAKYVSGIGIHWYRDVLSPIVKLDETHEQFPNHFLLYTESSNGYEPWDVAVMLGDWDRGESYSEDILWVRDVKVDEKIKYCMNLMSKGKGSHPV